VDAESANRKFQKELNAGAGALVVLGALRRVGRPMYGYEIGKYLEEQASDALPMHHGALYPTLRSLEKGGLLTSSVEPSVSGPPRRYYEITAQGAQALVDWTAAWKRTKQFVDSILEGSSGHAATDRTGDAEVSRRARKSPAKRADTDRRAGSGRRRGVSAE
jgi:PadR family transcriptional regulator PadR